MIRPIPTRVRSLGKSVGASVEVPTKMYPFCPAFPPSSGWSPNFTRSFHFTSNHPLPIPLCLLKENHRPLT